MREKINRYGTSFNASGPIQKSHIFDDFMNTNQWKNLENNRKQIN
jgi:hypothetical protein